MARSLKIRMQRQLELIKRDLNAGKPRSLVRLSNAEIVGWKARTIQAEGHFQRRIDLLGQWMELKKLEIAVRAKNINPDDPVALLSAVCEVFKSIDSDSVGENGGDFFDANERSVVTMVYNFCGAEKPAR